MSTTKPPRARKPRTDPSGQARGSAGKIWSRAGMALQQHLRDARACAEIAVDLKRRMRVPQIRQRAVTQLLRQHQVRVIAVKQARPEIDLPRFAPSSAAIAARAQRDAPLQRIQDASAGEI